MKSAKEIMEAIRDIATMVVCGVIFLGIIGLPILLFFGEEGMSFLEAVEMLLKWASWAIVAFSGFVVGVVLYNANLKKVEIDEGYILVAGFLGLVGGGSFLFLYDYLPTEGRIIFSVIALLIDILGIRALLINK